MSRLFIIGAGFSKAIADAPLANEIIKNIYEKTLNEDEKYKHRGYWQNDRANFIKLLNYFHESAQDLIDWMEKQDPERKIINRNFEEFLDSLNV